MQTWRNRWRAFSDALQQGQKSWRRLGLPKLLFLVAASITLVAMDLSAKASEPLNGDSPQQSAPGADNSGTSSGGAAVGDDNNSDYRLAPGDRLTVVLFDQPQLSGSFVIDGRGEILLPLAGSVELSGLTLANAQQRIQQRFADGVLVQPTVSVRMSSYRPIFVTGYIKKAGSYPFIFGETVKAAIAAAGGVGQAVEQPLSVAVSDFITAEERVRQLERNKTTFLVRKARLEAQRDGREDFVMPILAGLDGQIAEFQQIYSAEGDVFARLAGAYRKQVQTLQNERPLIDAALNAEANQITKQKEHLEIVSTHLSDLELLYSKGYVAKTLLLNQRIEKTLVEAQVSSLEAEVAHLRQAMGELDFKLGDLKAGYEKQILEELQETSQRLRDIETSLAPARKLLDVKAEAATEEIGEAEYAVFISRPRDGGIATFKATEETTLSPGDVIDVKLTHQFASPASPTEAAEYLRLHPSSLAEGGNK